MNLLRQDQVRKIILIILQKRISLINLKETNMNTATLNFHLSKLISSKIVEQKNQFKNYYLIKQITNN